MCPLRCGRAGVPHVGERVMWYGCGSVMLAGEGGVLGTKSFGELVPLHCVCTYAMLGMDLELGRFVTSEFGVYCRVS